MDQEQNTELPNHLDHYPKVRRFQLEPSSIKTIEDVAKVLSVMNIRIETDNPEWDEVKDYFTVEIIPRGFFYLLDKIGWEGIKELHFSEMEEQAAALCENEEDGFGFQITHEDDSLH